MSDFTITHFKQLKDAAGARMPGIEARFARASQLQGLIAALS
jgi:hypothetical protein